MSYPRLYDPRNSSEPDPEEEKVLRWTCRLTWIIGILATLALAALLYFW